MLRELFETARGALFRVDGLSYLDTLEVLCQLADCIDDADDVDWYIGECGECTLDSLVVGAYWFCADYHGGQSSKEYELLSRIGRFFDPGCTTGPEPESTDCDVYDALVEMHDYDA